MVSQIVFGALVPDRLDNAASSSATVGTEDGGQAVVITISSDPAAGNLPEADRLFLRIQSWDETKEHTAIKHLLGKQLTVTIDVTEPTQT